MHTPLVTIGLPVYNGASRMRQAIDSLLAQTYQHFELLISDNGSTDGSREIAQAYASADPRVRTVFHKTNRGQLFNIYFTVASARGDFFMLAADDDRWHPQFLADMVLALATHSSHGVAMSSFDRIDEKGVYINSAIYSGRLDLTNQSHAAVLTRMLLREPIHIFLYGVFRINLLRKLFSRPPPKVISWDRVVMAEMALATHFVSVPEVRFFKQYHRLPVKKRYRGQIIGAAFLSPYPYTRYVTVVLTRIFTSPIVPAYRKPLALIPWLRLAWRYKNSLWFEWRKAIRFSFHF